MVKRKGLPVWNLRWENPGWVLRNPQRKPFITSRAKWRVLYVLGQYMRNCACAFGPLSLRIYSKGGRIQEERTYPRSADPRSSKG